MMKIKKNIEKIPGGMMVIPLVIGAIIHTIWPKADVALTGVTGSYMVGTSVILFIFFFAVGTNINLKSSGKIAAKGVTLLLGKVILAAFNASNGGLYVALMTTIPNRDVDVAAYPFFSIQSGPFFTMITLGLAGIGVFPWPALVSTLVPFVLGMIVGGLDHDMRDLFSPLQGGLVPFFAFTIGYSLNLDMILQSGLVGILVGVLVVFVSGYVLYLLDRYVVRSDGLAGWAASSTAGAAVSVPIVIAQMNPAFKSTAGSATAIVATSVLVSAILTPIVTMWYYRRLVKKGKVTVAHSAAAQTPTPAK
ncbi:2-keto-3-deoxygluconate permease [Levilactobacillus brevis]|uniref:2-keto-3-deoxygluconate permease n=1 Tax=Levilactobacillus brevis TaxID=1580 RepID=UPI00207A9F2C|nr:2-keto-3-deoxygluconate permease [Levilactobacillus brevis]